MLYNSMNATMDKKKMADIVACTQSFRSMMLSTLGMDPIEEDFLEEDMLYKMEKGYGKFVGSRIY